MTPSRVGSFILLMLHTLLNWLYTKFARFRMKNWKSKTFLHSKFDEFVWFVQVWMQPNVILVIIPVHYFASVEFLVCLLFRFYLQLCFHISDSHNGTIMFLLRFHIHAIFNSWFFPPNSEVSKWLKKFIRIELVIIENFRMLKINNIFFVFAWKK